jgi:hypothetical protein
MHLKFVPSLLINDLLSIAHFFKGKNGSWEIELLILFFTLSSFNNTQSPNRNTEVKLHFTAKYHAQRLQKVKDRRVWGGAGGRSDSRL